MPNRLQQGFSLLEVLVAFAILALSLGVLLQIFSAGARGISLGEHYSKASLLADARLAALGVETALQPGEVTGVEDDRFHWSVRITAYDDEVLAQANDPPPVYRVEVVVWWEEGPARRQVILDSLRLGEN